MTLAEALNTILSPDKVKDMDTDELFKILLDNNIFASEADIRMFIIEGVQRALRLDDEFPIKVYVSEEEEIPEDHKYIDVGPTLTDDYIENNMTNE
jgi:hypothetical protein